MKNEELIRIKEIACAFQIWLTQETVESFENGKRFFTETNELMSLEDLFDQFIHEIYVDILLNKDHEI
jgi:hypothetical protein